MGSHHANFLPPHILRIDRGSRLVVIPELGRDQLAMAKLYERSGSILYSISCINDWLTTLPAVVVDDWLYIEGGQLYATVNGSATMYFRKTVR